MNGIIFAFIAGVFITFQSVFNTQVSKKLGLWETNTIVHITGLAFSIILMFFAGNGNMKKIGDINYLYLTGGIMGVIIIACVMKGVGSMGVTFTMILIIFVQLFGAALIDSNGWFGME